MNAERYVILDLMMNLSCPRFCSLTILGEPRSKARPRMGKNGRFYAPNSDDQDAVAWSMKAVSPYAEPFTEPVALACIFYRSTHRRFDLDNAVKLCMDAGTQILWADDSLVTAQTAILEYDPTNPRTIIAFGPRLDPPTPPEGGARSDVQSILRIVE
ncbi:MAG: RusA family crossover junction endodeoxyribonuclease [Actinomycetota bacterium]